MTSTYYLLTGCEGLTVKYLSHPRVWKYGPSLRACVKTGGVVFLGTGQAIRLINSLLYAKSENILKIHREFADNFPTNLFHEIFPNSLSQGFPDC